MSDVEAGDSAPEDDSGPTADQAKEAETWRDVRQRHAERRKRDVGSYGWS